MYRTNKYTYIKKKYNNLTIIHYFMNFLIFSKFDLPPTHIKFRGSLSLPSLKNQLYNDTRSLAEFYCGGQK